MRKENLKVIESTSRISKENLDKLKSELEEVRAKYE